MIASGRLRILANQPWTAESGPDPPCLARQFGFEMGSVGTARLDRGASVHYVSSPYAAPSKP
jgi:hypothetical protein